MFLIAVVFSFLFVLFLCVNIPGRENIPSTQDMIKRFPGIHFKMLLISLGLFLAVNSPYLEPYDCHDERTYKHYVENIKTLLTRIFLISFLFLQLILPVLSPSALEVAIAMGTAHSMPSFSVFQNNRFFNFSR